MVQEFQIGGTSSETWWFFRCRSGERGE